MSSQDRYEDECNERGKLIKRQGFYDPLKDQLLEPNLTGISYSFSADGYYEEALYRALANRESRMTYISTRESRGGKLIQPIFLAAEPSCPAGLMQWQHGSYVVLANGSLILTPIAVDGRQLLSEPCTEGVGSYTRYNNTEHFKVRYRIRRTYRPSC